MPITTTLQNTLEHVTDEYTPGRTIGYKAGITKATANAHLARLKSEGLVESVLRWVQHDVQPLSGAKSKNKTLFWRLPQIKPED